MVVHGWQFLTWNLWVAIGIVIYLAFIAAAIIAWRKRPRRPARDRHTAEPDRRPAGASGRGAARGGSLVVPVCPARTTGPKAPADAAWPPGSGDPRHRQRAGRYGH